MSFLVQHQYSIVAFLSVLLVISLSNLFAIRRLGDGRYRKRKAVPGRQPVKLPRVSVLVPTRNEEHNIAPCIRSLLAQDYPDFEVVVLDDGSEEEPLPPV